MEEKCKPENYKEEAFMSHQPSTKLKEMNLCTLLAGASSVNSAGKRCQTQKLNYYSKQ